MDKLNILIVASEVVPFAKSGGLADVAGALPKALQKLGHDVRVVMPRYYIVDKEKYGLKPLEGSMGVPMGSMGEEWCAVYEGVLPGTDVPVYFIEHDGFFGRKGLYDENGFSFSDNDNRFVFFSKAAMQLCNKIAFRPDILHANDWHTASIPLLLNTRFAHDEIFQGTASVLTIHNMQHQGHFYKGLIDVMEVPWEEFNPLSLESFGGINLLKGGIAHTDMLTTVSSKYADEIQTEAFGWGLETHIQGHSHKLVGIVNGIDYDEWHPTNDPYIAAPYTDEDLSGKEVCKKALQQHFGLPERNDVPLIGFVGRLAEQKGIDLVAHVISGLMHLDIQIVLLGTGEQWAEHFFSNVAGKYPDRFACHIGYSNAIAHQIEAGSDFFLMPSLFEPCGLNQLYSLSYGTLPIVRATGGLDDTIENYDPQSGAGTGFKFEWATADALYGTVKWAVDTWYEKPEQIVAMKRHAMQQHFGWDDSAKDYEKVYYYALGKRRN
ncbi:MAG: glycogen synthase GlgA [Campylobacterota bacterium]|nr:glycogen synthase GlgA [Campylobacterota bacterium]